MTTAPAALPWTVERYGDGDSLVIHSDVETRVCFMATPGTLGTQDRIEANAALICRAVNNHEALVKALELILPLAKGYRPENQTATARSSCNEWVRVAEEALARAKEPQA